MTSIDELSEYFAIMEMIEEGQGGDDFDDEVIEMFMGQQGSASRGRNAAAPNWEEGLDGRPSWATFVDDSLGGSRKSRGRRASSELQIDQEDMMTILSELVMGGPVMGESRSKPVSRAKEMREKKARRKSRR